jgi:hypothetical protein
LGRSTSWHAPNQLSTARDTTQLVTEGPIWGANDGWKGYAFLPVRIQGRAATVVIDLNCTKCDLSLSTAALAKVGITLPSPTDTILDSLTIGTDVQRHIPLQVITKSSWSVPGPDTLPPVVGIVGVHFISTRYDLLYDYPSRHVKLYAWPAQHVSQDKAWLPPGFTSADCGRMVNVPPGAATFTGFEMQLDHHPVTGVIEMAAYGDETHRDEKMNQAAFDALELSATSSRLQPLPQAFTWHDKPVNTQVTDVQLAVGRQVLWTGPVKLFPILDVQEMLPTGTPVMLLNLTTIKPLILFNSVSSKRVCFRRP